MENTNFSLNVNIGLCLLTRRLYGRLSMGWQNFWYKTEHDVAHLLSIHRISSGHVQVNWYLENLICLSISMTIFAISHQVETNV